MVKQQAKSQKEQAEAGAAASRRAGFLGCPRRLLFGVLPVAVLMTGCSSVNRNTGANTTDPLLGGVNLRPAVPATGPVPQGTPQTASPQAALPFPPADSGLSTAALAAGMSKPFDKERDLRIGNPAPSPADGWARQNGVATGNGSVATLGGPAPVDPGSRPDAPQTNPAANLPVQTPIGTQTPAVAQGNRVSTREEAYAQLDARGVLWKRLDPVPETGEYRFSCSVPNPRKPGSRRTYQAHDKNPVAAMQAVIDQIDKDR